MLALIEERPGIRAAELCRVLGIKSANMVALIAELEERGLVERDEHARGQARAGPAPDAGCKGRHAGMAAARRQARGPISPAADDKGTGDAVAPASPDLDGRAGLRLAARVMSGSS